MCMQKRWGIKLPQDNPLMKGGYLLFFIKYFFLYIKIELVKAIQKHFPKKIIPAMIENLDFLMNIKFLRGMKAAYGSE